MAAEKANAIVLRLVDFSETSAVVTLLTREFGRIAALAKGARRLKGPYDSALDLLTRCRIVFLRKSSGGLDLLTEARLERRFRPPKDALSRLYAGYYVAELLLGLTDDYDPHPELFDATDTTLLALAGDADVVSVVVRYEITLLGLLGHAPRLDKCVECGEPVPPQRRIAFGQLAGGVLCPKCRPGKKQVVSVSAATLEELRRFSDLENDSWRGAAIEPEVRGELRGVLNQYISNLLGRKPKMQSYLAALDGD